MKMRKIRKRRYLACLVAAISVIYCFVISGICVQAEDPKNVLNNLNLPSTDHIIQAERGLANESAASADTKYPSFFLLILDENGEDVGMCQAAFAADTDGSYYLITSDNAALVSSDKGYSFMLIQGESMTEAKIVAVQDGLAYLKADGVEEYPAYRLGRNWDEVKKDAYLWCLSVNDSEHSLNSSKIGDLTAGEQENGDCVIDEYRSEYSGMLGCIVADSEAKSAVGLLTLDSSHEYLIIKNFDKIEHPQEAAVVAGSQPTSGEEEDDAGDEEKGGTDNKDQGDTDDEEENQGGGDDGNTGKEDPIQGIFSEIPSWAWIIVAVVVIGVILFNGKSKKAKKENAGSYEPAARGAEGGTICLDSNEAMNGMQKAVAHQSSPVQASNYLVRGISGVFQGQIFQIGTVLRFGRGGGSDVMFPQETRGISNSHCELSLENGRIVLRDVGSSYGTYMGQGVKLVPQVVYYLQTGDEFYLADRTQLFRVENVNANGNVRQQGLSVKGLDGFVIGRTFFAGVDGKMYFGRGEGNQVHFGNQETDVSTSHCMLYQENGTIYLMDTNSMNGTFKDDGTRLRPNVPYRMNTGDKFYLVNRKNSFRINKE